MYQGVEQDEGESLGLNADALREISRLQENILQTLRNELKKLKEPEVMGASKMSTPIHEIGQDMTPLPSVKGSAVYLLKPLGVFSPISTKEVLDLRQLKRKGKKSSVSSQRSAAKYDYKLRNYPRPWADAPSRLRTLSTESLEVHVTMSVRNVSDMSETSIAPIGETVLPPQTEFGLIEPTSTNKTINEREKLEKVESSERWRKSLIFNEQSSQDPRHCHMTTIKLQKWEQQINRVETEVNYCMFAESEQGEVTGKNSIKTEQNQIKTVVFPPPIQESKKLSMGSRKFRKVNSRLSNKENKSLKILETFDKNNNNDNDEKEVKPVVAKEAGKSSVTKLPQVRPPPLEVHSTESPPSKQAETICEMIYQKVLIAKGIQATTLNDQASHTDDIHTESDSEFELGLFVATLVDDLVSKVSSCVNGTRLEG